MIDETSVNVLAFACVAFEFPDSAGGGQPLFGAFAAQIAFDDEGLLAKVRKVFLRVVTRCPTGSSNFLLAPRL